MLTAMAAAPSGVVLPDGGIIFELHPPLFGVLWAKAQSSSWTDNSGDIGVMTSLRPNTVWNRRLRVLTAMCRRMSFKGLSSS
jgi:hypothetical protein